MKLEDIRGKETAERSESTSALLPRTSPTLRGAVRSAGRWLGSRLSCGSVSSCRPRTRTPKTPGSGSIGKIMADETTTETPRNARKVYQGNVKSNKMDKSITVVVERLVRHPVYEKFIRRQTKFHAHDEKNEANIGDVVQIVATRPLSKLKRFRLTRIVQRAVID